MRSRILIPSALVAVCATLGWLAASGLLPTAFADDKKAEAAQGAGTSIVLPPPPPALVSSTSLA